MCVLLTGEQADSLLSVNSQSFTQRKQPSLILLAPAKTEEGQLTLCLMVSRRSDMCFSLYSMHNWHSIPDRRYQVHIQ